MELLIDSKIIYSILKGDINMIAKLFFPSSIGFIIMAVIVSFGTWTNSNFWIPISAILIILGIFTFVIRSTFNSMEARIKKLEDQNSK